MPANFEIRDLKCPEFAYPGSTIVISCYVVNTGDEQGHFYLEVIDTETDAPIYKTPRVLLYPSEEITVRIPIKMPNKTLKGKLACYTLMNGNPVQTGDVSFKIVLPERSGLVKTVALMLAGIAIGVIAAIIYFKKRRGGI